MNIENKIVFIAGGGSGLGKATAEHFNHLGATLVLFDRDEDNLVKTAQALNATYFIGDVTSDTNVEHAINKALQQHGRLDVAINCAGIAPAKRIIGREEPMPLSDFSSVVTINLVGTFNVMRVAAFAMSKNDLNEERGVIINTASIAAYEGQIGQAAYSASKGGIVSMTLPAARDLARHAIRVVTIAPGVFETPMMSKMPEEVKSSLANSVPFPKRLGQPIEYAKLAHHIVQNNLLNGCVIRLDGALRMS